MMSLELSDYVKEFQQGKKETFDIIYNSTDKQLFNVVYSFTKDEELTYDLMQETYVTFYSKADSIKMPQYTQKWLNVVAINKAKRYFENKKRHVLVFEEAESIFDNQEEIDTEFLPQEILESKEKQKIIKDIIDNLSIEQKTAVYLYYFNEMSLAEVAKEMDCSEGTVKSRLNYARKKIKIEVDSWEKKGTKLYSTGIPVLALLLKSQIQEAKGMDLDKAKDILNNIKNSSVGTSHISNGKTISKSIKSKIIASCVTGGIVVSVVAGYSIYNHNQDNLVDENVKQVVAVDEICTEEAINSLNTVIDESNNTKDEEQEGCLYYTYTELGINNVDSLSSSDTNIAEVFDFKEDRCIGVYLKSDVEGNDVSINVNGKQIRLYYEDYIWNEEYSGGNDTNEYMGFKELGIKDIDSINVFDSSIIEATLNKEEKYILIKQNGVVGESVITVSNNKGKTATIEIKCSQDSEGKVYISSTNINY